MIVEIRPGGSPRGITTMLEFVNGCARKVALNAASEPEVSYSLPLLTGTLFHALLEVYYTKGYFEPEDVAWRGVDLSHPNFGAAEEKAFRTFRAYRLAYDEKELGTVLGAEVPFDIQDPAVIGVPYTGYIDLVVKLTKRDCKRITKTRRVDLDPGIYVVDHKTTGGVYANTEERHRTSVQLPAYSKAYEYTTGAKVRGALINLITTQRDPKKYTFALLPSAASNARLLAVTTRANALGWPEIPTDPTEAHANASRCFDYNSVCPFWIGAQCSGY